MGVVYAARDHVRGGEVALKTLQAATLEAFERLRGEFLVLHDLVHPNLVALGELGDDGGRWFFTMERVHGPDFLGYVRPGGILDVAPAAGGGGPARHRARLPPRRRRGASRHQAVERAGRR